MLKVTNSFKAHENRVNAISFSPDGLELVTAGEDGMIKCWETSTGKNIGELKGHSGRVNDVIFCGNGAYIASGGADGVVRIWDRAYKTLKWVTECNRPMKHNITTFEITNPETSMGPGKQSIQEVVPAVNYLASVGRYSLVAQAGEDGRIKVWDFEKKKKMKDYKVTNNRVQAMSSSTDGNVIGWSIGEMIGFIDSNSLRPSSKIRTIPLTTDIAIDCKIGKPTYYCASADYEGYISIFYILPCVKIGMIPGFPLLGGSRLFSVVPLRRFKAHNPVFYSLGQGASMQQQAIQQIVFDNNSHYLLSLGSDSTCGLWNVENGTLVESYEKKDNHGATCCLEFSPLGSYGATGYNDGNIDLWQLTKLPNVDS